MTYKISDDGKSIACQVCGMTSHNPQDVEHKYCGNCDLFLEAIPQEEAEIIAFGRHMIATKYPLEKEENEFRDSLIRAFKKNRADFLILDSSPRSQGFLAACVAWAVDTRLLYNDRTQDDGQNKVYSFRLTPAGRKEILGL